LSDSPSRATASERTSSTSSTKSLIASRANTVNQNKLIVRASSTIGFVTSLARISKDIFASLAVAIEKLVTILAGRTSSSVTGSTLVTEQIIAFLSISTNNCISTFSLSAVSGVTFGTTRLEQIGAGLALSLSVNDGIILALGALTQNTLLTLVTVSTGAWLAAGFDTSTSESKVFALNTASLGSTFGAFGTISFETARPLCGRIDTIVILKQPFHLVTATLSSARNTFLIITLLAAITIPGCARNFAHIMRIKSIASGASETSITG